MKPTNLKIYLDGKQPSGVICLDISISDDVNVKGILTMLKHGEKGSFCTPEHVTCTCYVESWNKHVIRLTTAAEEAEEIDIDQREIKNGF